MPVTWKGLDELKAALMQNSEKMVTEAHRLASATAQQAKNDIQALYPQGGTGNLRRGVRINNSAGSGWMVMSRVKSTAPHAHLYEYGTVENRMYGGASKGQMFMAKTRRRKALTGTVVTSSISGNQAMPVVGKVASGARKRFYQEVTEAVERITGATVRGQL